MDEVKRMEEEMETLRGQLRNQNSIESELNELRQVEKNSLELEQTIKRLQWRVVIQVATLLWCKTYTENDIWFGQTDIDGMQVNYDKAKFSNGKLKRKLGEVNDELLSMSTNFDIASKKNEYLAEGKRVTLVSHIVGNTKS